MIDVIYQFLTYLPVISHGLAPGGGGGRTSWHSGPGP